MSRRIGFAALLASLCALGVLTAAGATATKIKPKKPTTAKTTTAKDSKPRRSVEEIMQEYGRVCAEIGDLEYKQKHGIPAALEDLYHRAAALNREAAEAKTNG